MSMWCENCDGQIQDWQDFVDLGVDLFIHAETEDCEDDDGEDVGGESQS